MTRTFTHSAVTYRLTDDDRVETQEPDGTWCRLLRRELLALDGDGPVWSWLRGHGIWRPSPSGKQTDSERGSVRVTLRLPLEAAAALERIAGNRKKNALVAELILREDRRRR